MNDSRCSGRNLTISMNVGHDIVPSLLLLDLGDAEIIVCNDQVFPHLAQGVIANGLNAELFLCFCQEEPKFAPCRVPTALGEQLRHLRGAVATSKGSLVGIEDAGI